MKLLSDEKVISALTQAFQDKPTGGLMPEEFREVVSEMQEDIVRCGECKHNGDVKACPLECPDSWYSQDYGDDFFCRFGERRTDETD